MLFQHNIGPGLLPTFLTFRSKYYNYGGSSDLSHCRSCDTAFVIICFMTKSNNPCYISQTILGSGGTWQRLGAETGVAISSISAPSISAINPQT